MAEWGHTTTDDWVAGRVSDRTFEEASAIRFVFEAHLAGGIEVEPLAVTG